MKKRWRMAVSGVMLLLMAGALTGCGKTEIDVMEGLELKFDGVDGYGTAWIADSYVWEEAAMEAAGFDEEKMTDDNVGDMFRGMAAIEEAVSYEVYPDEDLSNGDEVTVKATVDNESVEDYKIQFTGTEKKFIVEGLKELEEVDLFENVDVEFQGIAPYVKASIRNENSNPVISVRYSIDKSENLTVGDTVIMTAEYDEQMLLENGYFAGESTKEFVVPECDRYVTELSQIPSDTLAKMQKQMEDAIASKDWDTVTEVKYIGNYFLTLKPGMSGSDYNSVYVLFRIKDVDMTDPDAGETLYFYTYGKFKDILLLKDGICSVDLSDYEMPEGSAFTKKLSSGDIFWRGDYYYVGFEDLDTMFNKCVTKNIEKYEYETNVTEQ